MPSSYDAFIKAAEKVVRVLPTLAAISIVVVVLAAVIGGTSSLTREKEWASLFFMVGGLKTMFIAVPLALCVFTILMLLYGSLLFFYFRFRTPKA
jgi:hypothetical protein